MLSQDASRIKLPIAGYFHGWKFSLQKPEEAARIKFRSTIGLRMMHVNFELGIRGANFSFDEKRWNTLVSSLV